MRLKCVLCALFMCSGLAFAQIRDYVCVVRPAYADETRDFLLASAKKASSLGYRDLGDVITKKAKPGFGSGFLLSGNDGTTYVVTNRHVLVDADRVTLEFERADGTKRTIENCAVVAVSTELDLALVSLGTAAGLPKGLSLSARATRDGAEIWSAGYPGLGDNPSWQLGKGTVTNSSSRVSELIDPAVSTLIQHSAPIDPGNSGGPLLVSNAARASGYDVVGINTWKAFLRQATNFAVPAAALSDFVSRVNSRESVSPSALESRVDLFASVVSANPEDADAKVARLRKIAKLVSPAMTLRVGQDDLFNALAGSPTAVRDEVIQTLVNSSVLDAMRLASAWRLDEALRSGGSPVSVSRVPGKLPAPAGTGDVPVSFSAGEGSGLIVKWHVSQAAWMVADYSTDGEGAASDGKDGKDKTASETPKKEKKDSGTRSVSFENPYDICLNFEYGRRSDFSFYGATFGIAFEYVLVGSGAAFGSSDSSASEDSMFFGADAIEVFARLRLQLPISMDSFTITPYASARVGMMILGEDHDASGFRLTPVVGAEVVFGSTPLFIIGGGWIPKVEATNSDMGGFMITAGIGL